MGTRIIAKVTKHDIGPGPIMIRPAYHSHEDQLQLYTVVISSSPHAAAPLKQYEGVKGSTSMLSLHKMGDRSGLILYTTHIYRITSILTATQTSRQGALREGKKHKTSWSWKRPSQKKVLFAGQTWYTRATRELELKCGESFSRAVPSSSEV